MSSVLKVIKGHISVRTLGGVMVLVPFISSDDSLYIYL